MTPFPLLPGEEILWLSRPEGGRRGAGLSGFRLRFLPSTPMGWLFPVLVLSAFYLSFSGQLVPADEGDFQLAAWATLGSVLLSANASSLMAAFGQGAPLAYAITNERSVIFREDGSVIAVLDHIDAAEVNATASTLTITSRVPSAAGPIVMHGITDGARAAAIVREWMS